MIGPIRHRKKPRGSLLSPTPPDKRVTYRAIRLSQPPTRQTAVHQPERLLSPRQRWLHPNTRACAPGTRRMRRRRAFEIKSRPHFPFPCAIKTWSVPYFGSSVFLILLFIFDARISDRFSALNVHAISMGLSGLLKSECVMGYSFRFKNEAMAFGIIDFPESFCPTIDEKLVSGTV